MSVLQFEHPSQPNGDTPPPRGKLPKIRCEIAVISKIWNLQANSLRVSSSGHLNAKQRELLELQALAQRRLKGVRANFAEGVKTARETKRDLEWTQKRVR